MARKRRGRPVHGWLVIDKPTGMTSTQVVGRVRRALDAQKAGHGGTLDPLATGLLPIALGEATKTVSYVMDGAKAYRVTARFGIATDSDDAEGAPVEEHPHRPDDAAIRAALPAFLGTIDQVPPVYSAIKVDGQRAYDLARRDAAVDLTPRPVRVDAFDLVARPDPDHASFTIACGKGTYVRALVRDLARALGTVAHVTALRRTRCGPFTEATAISLEMLDQVGHSPAAFEHLLSVEAALDDIPALSVADNDARRLSSGQSVSLSTVLPGGAMGAEISPPPPEGSTVSVLCSGRLVALARRAGGEIRPIRVINL
ncbi:tRNA pseudouridine(55) synthase TruB [Roseospirillum parvum]|uniref:tRNA pseudouridine synthase B n=1 Tax=Roseospirillum parvum TaxID=83401 RepID=A0A1G8BZ07_9PROT|nr:tRNA pseudouridine(55) synthase TruB [Roseospirillum parvum]SDH38451.1 tRNA pseudouridine55 synthase [Roseospirillum parvum]